VTKEVVASAKKVERGNVEFRREGTKIVLPENMAYTDAITWLMRKADEDERTVAVHARIANAFPLDGLHAFHLAMKEKYGWVEGRSDWAGMCGEVEIPPTMISIETGPNKREEVMWGKVGIPGIEGDFNCGIDWTPPTPSFVLNGKVKQKFVDEFHAIVERTRVMVASHSLYKGKAIRLSWDWQRDETGFNPVVHAPRFLNLADVREEDLIFSDSIFTSIRVGLFTPIERTAACREYDIPLKRGVLLEGPFGTGKSMTALVTAAKASKHGWTFIYLDSVLDLENGLRFAQHYGPAVVFVEDVDKALSSGAIKIDTISNLLDGIETKGGEVMTVLTTNEVEMFKLKANQKLVRPGRIDTVIHLDAPDATAAASLVRLYGRGLLADDANLDAVGTCLAGKVPSFIREVVEKSKLAMVANDHFAIHEDDLIAMAVLMENHARLLEAPKVEDKKVLQIELTPSSFVATPATPTNS
jgi:ATPase family protein associated with various cellular activities (AAA)